MTTTKAGCADPGGRAPRFSLIVPVYNRIDEVRDLLESLAAQTSRDFEAVIVEDGSTEPCGHVCAEYAARGVPVAYHFKSNEGRSIARNHGMERASGAYFVFVDSDCILPPGYFEGLARALDANPVDCFGGPDAAHDSFTTTQKAINHSMTSFLTTGGIRGGKVQLERFTPRTFNMGFSRRVWERVGGFREMFSEDIDMSTRIRREGFTIALLRECPVYHKRRVDFRKFWRQVYVFGMSRITLKLLYPGSLKAVHVLPALAVVAGVALLVLGIAVSPWFLLPIGVYLLAVLATALAATGSPVIALKAVPAACIQLGGYGCGFLRAWFSKIVLGRGRDVGQEVEMRRGK